MAAISLAVERFRAFEDEHRNTATALCGLAVLLVQTGDPASSEPLLREALGIHEETLPEVHPGIALTRLRLGNCLLKLERFAEAEPLLLDALAVFEAAKGGREAETRSTLSQLARLNESLGRTEEAARYRARLEEVKPAEKSLVRPRAPGSVSEGPPGERPAAPVA